MLEMVRDGDFFANLGLQKTMTIPVIVTGESKKISFIQYFFCFSQNPLIFFKTFIQNINKYGFFLKKNGDKENSALSSFGVVCTIIFFLRSIQASF
jgi:hypothetical protein